MAVTTFKNKNQSRGCHPQLWLKPGKKIEVRDKSYMVVMTYPLLVNYLKTTPFFYNKLEKLWDLRIRNCK
jgi:hypothetical protein